MMNIIDKEIYDRFNEYKRAYNSQQELIETTVRGNLIKTAEELLRLAIDNYRIAQKAGLIQSAGLAPGFYTNRAELSFFTGWGQKTVYNHLSRLLQAGIVVRKVFRGSANDFQVWINPWILTGVGEMPTPPTYLNNFETNQKSPVSPKGRQILPHKDLIPSKEIANSPVEKMINPSRLKIKGGMSSRASTENHENQGMKPKEGSQAEKKKQVLVEKSSKDFENHCTGGGRENSSLATITISGGGGSEKGDKTSIKAHIEALSTEDKGRKQSDGASLEPNRLRNDSASAPLDATDEGKGRKQSDGAAKVPDRVRNGSGLALSDATTNFLLVYVIDFWNYAKKTIYASQNYSDQEERDIKNMIYRSVFGGFRAELTGDEWQSYYQECIQRIDMAKAYVARDPERRYIPPAKKYFDPAFKHGFAVTYAWYQKTVALKIQLHKADELKKARKSMITGKPPRNFGGMEVPPLQLFQYWRQRLEKLKDTSVMNNFYASCTTLGYTTQPN